MPDFEIRYFHADGKLALVHMSAHPSAEHAKEHAQINLREFARFELRDGAGRAVPLRAP